MGISQMASSRVVFIVFWASSISLGATHEEAVNKRAAEGNARNIWALLVAGDKDYINYRHQSAVCHAYQVLHNHGIPDNRIVVMMYDDIAYNSENPTPGVIVNHPGGRNVYEGVPKDYTGMQVTPDNFLGVLQGIKVNGGSGKVISSGPNDHIFLFFADHGTVGLVGFPNSYLLASRLIEVIKGMNKAKKYARMTVYMSACHSGSMFDGLLPSNVNVYAMTSARPHEESYSCFWDDERRAFLSDLFSSSWLEDSAGVDLRKKTLLGQYETVKKMVTTSHVMHYGDMNIANLSLSEFQGSERADSVKNQYIPFDVVLSRDVPVLKLRNLLEKASNETLKRSLKRKLEQALRNRHFLKKQVTEMVNFVAKGDSEEVTSLMGPVHPLRNLHCYERAVTHFNDNCFRLSENTYAYEYLGVLVNMCELHYSISQIREGMDAACSHPTVIGIH